MRILITNDDGIYAPGLAVLEEIAAELAGPSGEVWVVAPAFEQSGVGHCISFTHPMSISKLAPRRFAVEGSPADCVLAGLYDVLDGARPDLVLSGVNRGNNSAENVLYSGTIGGAIEGALHGLRAIALSQFIGARTANLADPFESARHHGLATIKKLLSQPGWQDDADYQTFYNVNFPPVPASEVKGLRAGPQGFRRDTRFGIDPHISPSGRKFLWIKGGPQQSPTLPGSDAALNLEGYISVTPPNGRFDRPQSAGSLGPGRRMMGTNGMSDQDRPDTTGIATDPDAQATRKMQFLFTLRSRGITDQRVLTAMEKIDRGDYVRGLFAERAYEDMPLPIACGQTISQPSIVGLMTQALSVNSRDMVLEVGTGSGYQAAILSQLARRVYTIDRHRKLVADASTLFAQKGLNNITPVTGDGSYGMPEQGPFDRIIVTAAAEDPPGPLLAQLKIGGIMVVPVGQSDMVQSLIKVTRLATGFDYLQLRQVRFVPLIEGVAND